MKKFLFLALISAIGLVGNLKAQSVSCIEIGVNPPVVCAGSIIEIPYILNPPNCCGPDGIRIEIDRSPACTFSPPLIEGPGNRILIPVGTQRGNYCVRFRCGNKVSVAKTFRIDSLDLTPPPSIIIAQTSPIRPSYCPDDTLSFCISNIAGAGTGYTIQWGLNDTLLDGQSDSCFNITNLQDKDKIYCLVTKQSPCALFATSASDTTTLRVNKKPKVRVVLAPGSTGCELSLNTFIAKPDSADPNSYFIWTRETIRGIDTLSQGINDTVYSLSPADSAKFGYKICVEIISGRCKLKAQDCFEIKACGQVFIDPPLVTEICAGTILRVPYTISGSFTATNVFKVQLSDSLGNFGNPVDIGTLVSVKADTILALIPAGSNGGDCFKVRIISSLPIDTSDSSACIKVFPKPIDPTTVGDSVCKSGSVTLSASSIQIGSIFQWYTSPFGGTSVFTGNELTLNITRDTVFYVSSTSANGCESDRIPVSGIINPSPDVEAGADLQKCVGDGPVTLTPFPTGGTWSGSLLVSSNVIDLTGVAPGVYTLFYQVSNSLGCITIDSLKINVTVKPVVNAGNDTTFCSNRSPVLLVGSPAGGIWSGTGIQSDGTFVPSSSGAGTFDIVYFFELNGCSASDTVKVTVNEAPPIFTVTTTNPSACNVEDGSATLAGIVTGPGFKVKWSVNRADSLSDPTLSNLDAGAYTVVVTEQSTGCSRTAAFGLSDPTVTPPVISGLDANYCSSDDCVTMIVVPNSPTGTWSGTGVVGNTFCPSLANLGPNVIVYSYDTVGGCTGSSSVIVRVNQSPVVNAGGPIDTVCRNIGQFVLTGFSPPSPPSVWSPQPLVTTSGTVNLSLAATGNNTLTLTRTLGTCTATDTRDVFVIDNPEISISRNPASQVCVGSSLVLTANVSNGATVVRYEWFKDNIIIPNENDDSISVSLAGSYTVRAIGVVQCENTSLPILVNFNPLPSNGVTPSGILTPCSNNPTVLTADSLTGYTYQWFGLDSIAGATSRKFVPLVSGQYKVRIKNSSGCTAFSDIVNVNILDAPVAPIIAPPFSDTCLQAGQPITITVGSSGAGLSFIWKKVANPDRVLSSNGPSITLDTIGSYYATVIASNGCFAISDTINLKPTIKITVQDSIIEKCVGDNQFVVSGLSPSTGCQLLFNGVPLQNNIFNPDQIGNYILTYQCGSTNGCISRKNIEIRVTPLPLANLSVQGPTNVCQGDTVRLILNDGVETGCSYQLLRNGTAFGPAVNTAIIPVTLPGSYSVLVTCVRCSTLSNSIQVNFNPKPTVNPGLDLSGCSPLIVNLNAAGVTPGAWSGSPRVTSTGAYNSGTFIGCDSVTLTVVNPTTLCSNSAKKEVCIFALPDFNVATQNATACLLSNGSAWVINGNSSVSYEWTKVGDPTILSVNDSLLNVLPGVYKVKITSVFNICSIEKTVIINSPNNLEIQIAGIQDSLCANSNPVQLTGVPQGGIFSSLGNRILPGPPSRFDPSIPGLAIDTIFYTVNVNGCVGTGKKAVKINSIPVLDAGPNEDVCFGDTLVLTALQPSSVPLLWVGQQIENDNLYVASDPGITSSVVSFGYSINGCSNTASKTITVRPLPEFEVVTQDVSSCGLTDGKVVVNILNQNQFQIIVRNVQGNVIPPPRDNLPVGVYTVKVTNNTTGCVKDESFGITGPTNINPFVCLQNVPISICQNDPPVTIGKCRPSASIFINGVPTQVLNPAIYIPNDNIGVILTDTDANGCIGVEQKIVGIKGVPSVNVAGTGPLFACTGQGVLQLTGFFPSFDPTIPENGWTSPGSPAGFITREGRINPSVVTSNQTFTLRYTAKNADGCSEFKEVTFNIYATPVASIVPNTPNISICLGSYASLSSLNQNAGYAYTWYLGNQANPPQIGFGSSLNATLGGPYRLIVNNNGCTSSFSDIVNVTTTPAPVIVSIGPDSIICQTSPSFGITTPIVSGVTSTAPVWTGVGSTPAGFISPVGIVNPSLGLQGPNKVRFVVTNGNCSDTAERIFTVIPTINSPIQVNGSVELCDGDEVALIAQATGAGYSYEWSRDGSVILNENDDTLIVKLAGEYKVKILINGNGSCSEFSTQTVTITVRPSPVVNISGDTILSICYPASTIDLNAERPFSPSDAIWSGPSSIVSSNGVITPNNIPADGDYVLTLTKTIGTCSTSKSLTIRANRIPDANFTANPGAICDGDSVSVTYLNPNNYLTTWLRDNNVILINVNAFKAKIAGNYSLIVNNNGCIKSESKSIFVSPKPVFGLKPDTFVCKNGSPILFNVINPSAGVGVWSGSGINQNSGNWSPSDPLVPSSGFDTITYTLTSEDGCITKKSTIIRIDAVPEIKLTANPETIEIKGPSILTASGGVKFEWSPTNTLNQNNGPSVSASPMKTERYTVKVTSDKNCINEASITVNVDEEFKIYDAFSPNGDQDNDEWVIKNIQDPRFAQATVKVFNRWGNLVYESEKGYPKPWDGSYEGKQVPPGAYFYIIDFGTGSGFKAKSGSVTILR